MTEHSIKELERQLNAARSRRAEAEKAVSEIERQLVQAKIKNAEAEMAARGIVPGMKLVGFGYDSWTESKWRTEVGIYKGYRRSWRTEVKIWVAKIKKDGSAHAIQDVSRFNDVQEWVSAEEDAQ